MSSEPPNLRLYSPHPRSSKPLSSSSAHSPYPPYSQTLPQSLKSLRNCRLLSPGSSGWHQHPAPGKHYPLPSALSCSNRICVSEDWVTQILWQEPESDSDRNACSASDVSNPWVQSTVGPIPLGAPCALHTLHPWMIRHWLHCNNDLVCWLKSLYFIQLINWCSENIHSYNYLATSSWSLWLATYTLLQ